MLYLTPALAQAEMINVLNSGFLIDASGDGTGRTETLSFNAGAIADKIVVQVAGEGGSITSITYNGVPLTLAAGTTGGGGRNKGIYYLDNPYTGGAADLSVTLNVTGSNGLAFGLVSLAETADGVSVIAPNVAASSVSITPTVENSFVMAGNANNSSSGGTTAAAPLAQLYGGVNIGSARAASGYNNGVPASPTVFSFDNTVATDLSTSAAAFAPLDDGRIDITDLYATGVDANRVARPNGTVGDLHYTLTSVPSGSTNIRIATSPSVPGVWIGDGPTSAWIGANNAANLSSPPGSYTAETTFTIGSEADLSTVVIHGSWAADNAATDILLNGNSLGISGGGFGDYQNFTIGPDEGFFQYGTNTLSFVWTNSGVSNNSGGLRVGYLVGSYLEPQLVPEPHSIALFSIALIGVFGIVWTMKRRRQS